ncbi:glycosyltransferase [Ancylobacter sp. TS-1]|uniref:glycosyltransferase n=1 Tax=Ancylobacter sp. TS-1 TaxID=1850374 RepID=UPI001265BBB3|nr:glycosyltransferase [Ancylobacter sp. TS-1]QFR34950.1 glycosyltransferase [Ancylobacter sp. TS-1]
MKAAPRETEFVRAAAPSRPSTTSSAPSPAHLPLEAAGVADQLSAADIVYAGRQARRHGVGMDETLIANGMVSPDDLARGAARTLSIPFEPLDDGTAITLSRPHFKDIAALLRTGLMRRFDGGIVTAARGPQLRQLAAVLAQQPRLRRQVSLTTPERLSAFVRRRFAQQIGWNAVNALGQREPGLSAASLHASRYVFALLAVASAALLLTLNIVSVPGTLALVSLLALLLLGGAAIKLTACTLPAASAPPPLRKDDELPYYSLIVPLYREASVVPQLIRAIDAIDYPREKLQILLAVEPDDHATVAALATHAVRPGFEVIVSPAIGPRTKPKAMNAALPFARGAIVGIYDAEDVPDPLQLRRACALFLGPRGARIGCVQACLAIDNLADSWITRQFAAEYAAHFDVVLPMLGAYRLPLPLGGTSNHFRRAAIEAIGAWDPHNVTEDAEIGVRLAGAGWRTAVIASATDEEAPRRIGGWMRQRTRWYKGWMQTLLVHGRRPARLAGGAGWTGTLALLFMLGSGLAAALLHPFLVLSVLIDLFVQHGTDASAAVAALDAVGLSVMLIGYGSAALTTVIGMRRRRVPGLWGVLALMPLYWLMMSAAAWRAVLHLVIAPHRWEKTEHGLARTSRRRALLLRKAAPRGSGAARRQPRPADA